jgi:23S rRNA (cytidine1920-2'-O)/16S rRNA (cytidine1409-2'-O)-methyltransferase
MVDRGLAASRARAQELIREGLVMVNGHRITKPAAQVDPDKHIVLGEPDHPWVGRGALKLLSVIDAFGVDPTDLVCADLGASTGGFTEVLLERGATRVYAIDVGKGQLHYRLRDMPRVVNMEGVNARHLANLPDPIDLIVGDLSFISLGLILPTVHRLLAHGGEAIVLVKPQFEVGRDKVRKGRVSDADRLDAIAALREESKRNQFEVVAGKDSGLAGAKKGNVEHFLHLRKTA